MDQHKLLNLQVSAKVKTCGPLFKIHDQFHVSNSRSLNTPLTADLEAKHGALQSTESCMTQLGIVKIKWIYK